jgi:hypothetical protein
MHGGTLKPRTVFSAKKVKKLKLPITRPGLSVPPRLYGLASGEKTVIRRCRVFAAGLLASVVCSSAATFIVTTTEDDGPGSLRQAIQDAGSGDTITFSLPSNSTITLTSGELLVNKSLTIQGPGSTKLTVQRSTAERTPDFRIFNITVTSDINITISGLLITNGGAPGDSFGGLGGGILDDGNNTGGTVTVARCMISGNQGGIANFHTTLILVNSIISANSAGNGGGINNNGTVIITNSTIFGNIAVDGGGIYNYFGTLAITSSTICGNSATSLGGGGGGIFNTGGVVTITNSTISGNAAGNNGGGIHNNFITPGSVGITNSLISGNSAKSGGGIYSFEATSAANTIIARNGALKGPDMMGTLISEGFNLIGNRSSYVTIIPALGDIIGTSASPIDPLLGPLQDNGGPTQTHALLPGSPAINAGNDDVAPPQDQRNYVRQNVSDIGAFESGATIPVTLGNISTRGFVQTGNNLVIGGLIISGGGPKAVIARALGPTLGQPPFNVPNALANPILELHDSTGTLITSNDDWTDAPNAQEIMDSGFAPPGNLESAILTTLDPGNYTAVVRGENNGTGIAIFESYDLDFTAGSKFGNISTRGFVQTNEKIMIAGIIVRGSADENVLVRGLGPTLGQPPFNVPNALANPFLDLRDANGTQVMSNDNWKSSQEAEIQAGGLAPPNDLEAAIAITLSPGNYTALLTGVNNTTGNALVEVYGLN